MEQTNYSTPEELSNKPARPPFLNTLCILSFIMGGLMVLTGIWGVISSFMPYSVSELESIERMKELGMDPAAFEKNPVGQIISLLFQVVSLFGVVMMWKLRKTGFYLYILGEIAPYIYTIAMGKSITAMMGSMGSMFSTVVYVSLAIVILINVAFIIMYALNLKHMR